jgi:hypothetical protein
LLVATLHFDSPAGSGPWALDFWLGFRGATVKNAARIFSVWKTSQILKNFSDSHIQVSGDMWHLPKASDSLPLAATAR